MTTTFRRNLVEAEGLGGIAHQAVFLTAFALAKETPEAMGELADILADLTDEAADRADGVLMRRYADWYDQVDSWAEANLRGPLWQRYAEIGRRL